MRIVRPVCLAAVLAVSPAYADVAVFFTDHGQFTQWNLLNGKVLKGIEDFEYSSAEQGSKHPFPNSLQNGVPAPTLPNGILSPNLIIQSNITPSPCPPTPNPSASPTALWVNGAGFLGSNSIKVGTDEFLTNDFSSIDLIFTSNDKTGVGVDVSTYTGFALGHAGFIVCAYDLSGNILGSLLVPGPTPPEPGKSFVGVWSPVPIGRVNVWGIFDVPQPFAVDNIEMWAIPAPSAGLVLAMGGLAALRRRR